MEPREGESKRSAGRWLERLLLSSVLALQVAILLRLERLERSRAADSTLGTADMARGVSPQPGDSAGPHTRPASAAAGEPSAFSSGGDGFSPYASAALLRPAPRFGDEMDALWRQALHDFEHLENFMRHWDKGWSSIAASPAMDMRDEAEQYVVLFCLPGLNPADVNVTLEGRLLCVAGRSRGQARSAAPLGGGFERRVLLPGPVGDETAARAFLTNGLLKIMVPKAGDGGKREGRLTRLF